LKDNECGNSRRDSLLSFEVKKLGNKAPHEQTQDSYDLEMVNIPEYHIMDPQLKESGCSGTADSPSRLREFKRLKQRDLELDNERTILTKAIGNETGLTANMQQLHEYNLIKDITQLIIGSLSGILHIPVTQLHQELNLNFQK